MGDEDTQEANGTDAFAQALAAAIAARGATLRWLHDRLAAEGDPVSKATLSYWRSGARRPEGSQSLAAVDRIEQLLGVDRGQLTDLIGPSLRVGPVGRVRNPGVGALDEHVSEVLAALGDPRNDRARDVSTHVVTEVGADGYTRIRRTRSLLQATGGTLTHVPYLDIYPDVPEPAPEVVVISGGRIVARASHPSDRVHGVLFELDHPVPQSQTTMFEFEVRYGPGVGGERVTAHGVARVSRELILWTRFHPDAVPDWIEELEEGPDGEERRELPFDGRTSVRQVRRRFGPGMLALTWGYDAAR